MTITYDIIARKNKIAKLNPPNRIGDRSAKLNSRRIFRPYCTYNDAHAGFEPKCECNYGNKIPTYTENMT